jgi:hypothetical protein
MLIAISSPFRKAGLLYEKWKAHFGKDTSDVESRRDLSLDGYGGDDGRIDADLIRASPVQRGRVRA